MKLFYHHQNTIFRTRMAILPQMTKALNSDQPVFTDGI